MKKDRLVYISDFYINDTTRETKISSKHSPIIRHLVNASDDSIKEIKQSYIDYEKEYTSPMNKVRRLVKKIGMR